MSKISEWADKLLNNRYGEMKEKWLLTFWAWKTRGWLGVVDDTYLVGKYSVWDAIGNPNGQKI